MLGIEMFLRVIPESVRFMILVTDPRNETVREIIKVDSRRLRGDTSVIFHACSHRTGHAVGSRQAKPPVLPTPTHRQKKPLIVEVVDNVVSQKCASKASVEQVEKAPMPQPQQPHGSPAQQVVEQIIAVPAGSQKRTKWFCEALNQITMRQCSSVWMRRSQL